MAMGPAPSNTLTRQQNDNVEVITSVSNTIRSIEQLLDAIQVDRAALDPKGDSEWVVETYQANKWDQGSVVDGVQRVVELWQIKATLRRRKAIPVLFEPVRPLNLTLKLTRRTASAPRERLRRCLIVPDSQNGYARGIHGDLDPLHDRTAWACMIEVAQYAQPNHVIFLGDMLDLPDWSDKFVHGPEFEQMTQPALVELAWWLGQTMQTVVPYGSEQIPSHYLSGNHENRLIRALHSRLPVLARLRPVDEPEGPPIYSLDRLLGLSQLGITWHEDYPHGEVWLNDNLRWSHGEKARAESGDTARIVIRDARNSEGFGHLHRIELVFKTTHPRHGAVTYLAFCPGTLARIDGRVPAATSRVNWQQGFALADYEPENGMFLIQPIPIHSGKAIYDGRVFTGRFSMDDLRDGTPGWKWAA